MQETIKKALNLYNEKKFDEALCEFLEVEKEDEDDARLLNNIGLCYANSGNFGKAEEYYTKALSLDSKQAQTYVNLSDILFHQRKLNEAIELLQDAIYELPEDVTIRHYLARIYMEDKRYEEAIPTLDSVLELYPGNPDAHWDLGMIYFELGDWYSAIANFEQVIEVVDNNPLIYYQLGLSYEANNEIDKAMTNYLKALTVNEHFPLAYKKLGTLFMARNEYDNALEYFESYMNYELPEEEKQQIQAIVENIKQKKEQQQQSE